MLFLVILLFVLSVVLGVWGAYQVYVARKIQEMNVHVGQELENLLTASKVEVAKNRKLVESARELLPGSSQPKEDSSSIEIIDDPAMLASVLTVIVNKYGTIRLGIADFSAIGDDQFVSVYIDTKTQDLLLSLNQDLDDETEAMLSFVNISGKDDSTYH